MADYTPILSLPQVGSNQEQKEATINTALAILEAAMNDSLDVSLAAGNVTLTTDQFTKYFLLQFQGHTVARTVTIPATPRWFAIENQGTGSVTVTTGSGQTAELPSGKIGLIVSDGTDLRFVVPDAINGMGLLADLSDVSGVPTDKQLLRWDAAASNWMPWSLKLTWNEIFDTPDYNFLVPGRLLAVNADGSGLEWTSSAANVNSFIDLDDAPSSYTNAANRAVRVNNAGTGLVFATPTLRENSDFPVNYNNAAGKFLQVNPAQNGVQFALPKISDLTDGPGQPVFADALMFLRVNAAGTGLEYVPGSGGPVNFTELLDTPDTYTGAAGRIVRVAAEADRLIYSTLRATELSDFPASYAGQANKWLRVNSAQTGVTFADPKVIDLSDGPGAFAGNAKKFVRVNTSSNALEYYAARLTDLADFPTAFTGQGGKFLQVKPGEDGVRFVASSFSAAFLDLTDTPDLYTGQAGMFVAVNPAGDGLIFKAAAVNLNDLLDVDVDSAIPGAGNVLMYRDGAWTAEALPASATNLNALTDVDLTTGTPGNGNVLTYRDGAWTAEPAAAAGVTYLAALLDVDFGSGEPAEGMSLVYRSGAWSAETLVGGGGPVVGQLNDLSDVDLSTGTPANGQVLTYNNGAWTAEDAIGTSAQIPAYRGEFGSTVYTFSSGVPAGMPATPNWSIAAAADAAIGQTQALVSGASSNVTYSFTINTPQEVLTLRYRMSTGASQTDPFRVFVDTVQVHIDTAAGTWKSVTIPLGEGTSPKAVEFRYVNSVGGLSTDRVEISQISFSQADPLPYVSGDTVTYQGKTYLCLTTGTATAPTSTGDWRLLSRVALLNDLDDVDVDSATPGAGNVLMYRDGAWTAEAPAVPLIALDALTDVTTPAPTTGDVLTFRDGQWVNENPASGGVPAYGAYAYWRLLLHTTDGGPRFGVQELEFKNSKAGGDLANGGTAFASSSVPGQPPEGAFDNVIGGRWDSNTATDGEFIGYQFLAPVEVRYVTIMGAQDTPNLSPASFSVQYSEDGVTYTTAWEVTGQTGWTAGQTREFHGLLDLYFTDLADVPQSFVGQAGKSLRVNTGGTALEFYVPASPTVALNDLTDVDVDTTPAVAGSVLTYRDGAWTAEVLPAHSLNDLSDVDTSTGAPSNGSVLTYKDGAWSAEPAQSVAVPDVALADLTDVTITDPAEGDTIVYRGGEWVSASLSGDYGSHAYWRIYITQTVDGTGSGVMINNLAFRAAPGAATLTTGGTPMASSGNAANAYDAIADNTMWQAAGVSPQWLGYQFAAPVSVVEIAISATNVYGWAQAYLPRDFKVQYSDNGTTWSDAWAVAGDAPYNAEEVRTHTSPGVFSTFLGLADAPDTYVGQGGKAVRVKANASGLEFNSGVLNDLNDVTITGTPITGATLTYIGGQWVATPPGGAEVTFGVTTPTGSAGSVSNGFGFGRKVALNKGDTVTDVVIAPDTTSATPNIIAFIYADNAGAPGALLAQSAIVTGVTANVLKSIPLITPYEAPDGRNVWVGFLVDAPFFAKTDSAAAMYLWYEGDMVPSNPVGASGPSGGSSFILYGKGFAGSAGVSDLADLGDVDLTTGTPANGSVLTYNDGAWTAEMPAVGSGGGAKDFGITASSSDSTWTNGYGGTNAVAMLAGETLESVCFEPVSTVSTVQVIAFLYADNAGAPGALIGQSAIATGVTTGVTKVLPLVSPYIATTDTIVWVGFQSTTTNFQIATHTGGSLYWSEGDLVPANPAPTTTSVWATAWTIYGRGSAAGSSAGPVALDDLTDVDLTTGTPDNGAVLTYRDGAWTAETPAQQSVPVGGKHAYWRLNLLTSQGSAYGVAKLVMAALAGGVDQAVGGTPLSTNDYTAGGTTYDRFKAFDSDASTFWASNDVAASTLGYQFLTPVALGEIRLTTRPVGGFGAHGPTSFQVQWSDNGTAWTTAWTVNTPATWTEGGTRNFAAPMESVGLALDDLTDVDLSTAPTDGQILTYLEGEWVAADAPEPSTGDGKRPRNRGPFGDTSVYLKRTFEAGMPEGFEGATLAGWTIESQVDNPQTTVLKSAVIGGNASTQFNFTAVPTFSKAELRVRYKISSEATWDKFRILVDGVEVHVDSGNDGVFENKVVVLAAGERNVTFSYTKDGSGNVGTDNVVISYVEFAYTDPDFLYIVGDIVTYADQTYQCLVDSTTETPGTGDDWSLLTEGVLDALLDVDIDDPTTGDVLTYDNGVWKAQPAGGSIALGDLTLTHGAPAPTALEPSGSLYLQDEAGDGYISDATISTGPQIVQVAHDPVISDGPFSVTFATAPVEGNWLIAFMTTNGGTPTLNAGWTSLKANSGGGYIGQFIAYRQVGASETTSVTVGGSGSGADPLTVYEIANLGTTWADFYDNSYIYTDAQVQPPFDLNNHMIAGPHGFGIAVIAQRETFGAATPGFTGGWVLDDTYADASSNRQSGAGHLPGKTAGEVVQVNGTISGTASHYGYSVVYFKGDKPYGAFQQAEWNKILLEGKAALGDLGDVDATTPANGTVLTWNATTSKWEAQVSTSGLSGEGEPSEDAPLGTLYSRRDIGQAWVSAAPSFDTTKRPFSATGAQQTYTVPEGISSVEIKMWGAAGGGGLYSAGSGASGAGGYTTATIPVTVGDVLALDVGRGGGGGTYSVSGGLGGWPDGGFGSYGDVSCGGGGGSSRVWKNGVLMAVAGAGGGGSGYQGPAGAGGGVVGENGPAGGGTGGTQLAGGVDAGESTSVPKQGGYLSGGKGTSAANNVTFTNDDGAGGGGGYYGGGGGGGDGASGGGGSGYLNTAAGVTGVLTSGSGLLPAGIGDPDYVTDTALGRAGVSSGTGTNLTGGHGRIVVTPVTTVMGWERLATTKDLEPLANLGLEDATLTSNEGLPTAFEPKGSLYIDETTGTVYQSGGTSTPLSVVQLKNGASNGATTTAMVLPAAPTQGNWLVCLFATASNAAAVALGWTFLPGAPAAGDAIFPHIAYKKVGAGESATQTAYTSTSAQGAYSLYEISGGGDDFSKILDKFSWQDDSTYTTAPSGAGTPMVATADGMAFLLVVSAPWSQTPVTETPWTSDGAASSIGDNRTYRAFRTTAASGATVTPKAGRGSVTDVGYASLLLKSAAQPIWVPFRPASSLDDLTDVTLGVADEGEVLTYVSGQWRAEASARDDLIKITPLTVDRVLVLADRTSALVMNATTDTVVTVPLASSVAFPVGTTITILRRGTGTVSIQPAVGVTIEYPIDAEPFLRSQASVASLLKIDTNTWSLFGDLLGA